MMNIECLRMSILHNYWQIVEKTLVAQGVEKCPDARRAKS
jgi:hypothetical protein